MTQVIFLGVGGAMARNPADNHTALLVRSQGTVMLLDCGPSVLQQLERVEVGIEELTHLFVSHQHGDHTLGFPMIMLNRILFWPERTLHVLALPQVLDSLHRLIEIAYPDLVERMHQVSSFTPLTGSQASKALVSAGDIHYATACGKHGVPTVAVRLTFGDGQTLVYTSDTAASSAIAKLAGGVDLLVHEAFYLRPPQEPASSHSVAEEVGELAAQAGVRSLALVHRGETDVTLAHDYRVAAAKYYGGPILIPNAGDTLVLEHPGGARATPSTTILSTGEVTQ